MTQKDNSHSGYPVNLPDADYPHEKLFAVSVTLKQNLQNIPMLKWQEPIDAALCSAYLLGKSSAPECQQSEDKALEAFDHKDPEEIGYDFIAALAKHFGQIASESGVNANDLRFDWVKQANNTLGLRVSLPGSI